MKYLIFDFDGVIADTLKSSLEARVNIGLVKTMKEAIEQSNNYFDNKPSHTRDSKFSKSDSIKSNKFVQGLGEEIAKSSFPMFLGFIEEIKKIIDKKVAIVSSGADKYVLVPSRNSGLDPTHILTFDYHHSKEEKIEKICIDWGVSVKDIYYFTDSRADVYELQDFLGKGKIIGVSWGYCGYEKLRELLPEKQVLKNFADIHGVF